jgi:hypothetical protein
VLPGKQRQAIDPDAHAGIGDPRRTVDPPQGKADTLHKVEGEAQEPGLVSLELGHPRPTQAEEAAHGHDYD